MKYKHTIGCIIIGIWFSIVLWTFIYICICIWKLRWLNYFGWFRNIPSAFRVFIFIILFFINVGLIGKGINYDLEEK